MKRAELKVVRFEYSEESTISEFYLNNTLFGYTLEDKDRGLDNSMTLAEIESVKVFGKTAIPAGVYQITLYNSPKHGLVPLLLNVKGYSYIEIHAGNFPKQSLGCLLLGSSYGKDVVKNSKPTVLALVEQLKHYDEIIITILRRK